MKITIFLKMDFSEITCTFNFDLYFKYIYSSSKPLLSKGKNHSSCLDYEVLKMILNYDMIILAAVTNLLLNC